MLTVTKTTTLRLFYLILFFVPYQPLFSQVELVMDINEGAEDSGVYCEFNFTYNQDCVVRLGDKILFYAENTTFGRELYVLEDENVELLVDLNNDATSSNPQYLTLFNDLVYFIADDNTGYKVWQTDGTASGTKVAFDLGVEDATIADYKGFLINEDELYFEFQESIYVYNGQDLNQIMHDNSIDITGSSAFNSFGWCTYKEGIAVMAYNGASWDMLYIHDNMVETLFNFIANDSSKRPYALAAFEGGISFGFEASFDATLEGRYLYLDGETSAVKQSDMFTVRSYSVNNESALLYSSGEFILYNEDNPMGTQALSGNLGLVQGEDWNRLVSEGNLIFQSSKGTFEDDIISLLNTEDGTIKTVYTGDDLTKMYTYEDYLFFFAESQNSIFDEALYQYTYSTGELEQIYEFVDLSFNTDFYPIGVQEEYLYFYGNVDNDIGVEVYRIAVDIASNTQELTAEKALDFIQVGTNTFLTQTDIVEDFNIEIYNINGQLIKRALTSNNSIIEIPYVGIVIIKANLVNTIESHMKIISQ